MPAAALRSAGFVVARPGAGGWRYLVLRAFRNWDFPKGVIEPAEVPLAAALRELSEETGLVAPELRWGEVFREMPPYGRGKVARFHLGVSVRGDVRLPVSAALGRPEHHEVRWATYAEARRLISPRLAAVLDWAHTIVEGG